jgi:oligosaccharide repeat unit polymerase
VKELFLLAVICAGFAPVIAYIFTDYHNYYETTHSYLVISWNYVIYHAMWLILSLLGFFLLKGKKGKVTFYNTIYSQHILFLSTIILFFLTIIGYITYFYLCRELIGSWGSNDFLLQKKLIDLTGTGYPIVLIHLHLACSILCSYLLFFNEDTKKNYRRYLFACLYIIIILDVVRSFGIGERLALVECILPPIIYFLLKKRFLIQLKYISVLIVGLIVFFVASESVRSWIVIKENNSNSSVWIFGIQRLLAYYTSSLNNASLAHEYGYDGTTTGYYLLRGFSNTPLLSKIFNPTTMYGEDKSNSWSDIIESIPELTPEFNLFSAPGFSFLDFGYAGLLVGFFWGCISGLVVRGYRSGNLLSALFFPICIVSALELSRTLYFTLERNVPTYFALVSVYIIIFNVKKNRQSILVIGKR